jgi:hypothetical protein
VLVPLAIDMLERDPLAEGDHYEGDLLTAVMRVETSFWTDNRGLPIRVERVVHGLPAERRADEAMRRSLDQFESE